jgi:Pectinacetylesterase
VHPKLDLSTPQRDELFPRFGPPIPRAAPGSWQWIDFPDTAAGDGSPTGLAINFAPDPHAKRLVVYFQAGGACWDYTTASLHVGGYGAVMHLNGFGRAVWERSLTARIHRKMWLFDRDDPTNPFRDAHLVYIPYCTGDIYVGDRVSELRGPLPFMRRTVHFRGQANVRAYLSRLVPTFPELSRVYLVGSSAGGFGATFSWWLANEAFRTVPIDVIADAGHPVLVPKAMFDRWIEAWGPRFPHHGDECRRGLKELLEFAERHYLGPDRYALISTRKDAVLSGFFGMLPATHARYIDELRAEFFDDFRRYPRARHARYFIMDSYGHTVFPGNQVEHARIGKMALRTWLTQMVEEDPAWSSWYEREGAVSQS